MLVVFIGMCVILNSNESISTFSDSSSGVTFLFLLLRFFALSLMGVCGKKVQK